jgi:hypothetical protein
MRPRAIHRLGIYCAGGNRRSLSDRMFNRIADNTNPRSLAARLRRRRLALFSSLLATLPAPIRILDVGGTELFWQMAPLPSGKEIRVTLLNLEPPPSIATGLNPVAGDARLIPVRDGAFDVVFSNSVIEHVGDPKERRRMADEIRRVGTRYFVQTPNRRFPVEPHFVFPLYQFLPSAVQVWLLRTFNLGWIRRTPDASEARRIIHGIRLLDHSDMIHLFPEAVIYEERLIGLTKSFVAYHGW